MLRHPRRHTIQAWLLAAAWLLLAAATGAALAGLVGWLPNQVYTFLVGVLLALTVLAVWQHAQAPVRAAFLDGMIYQRQNAAADPLPRAVGDGSATVIQMGRPRPRPRRSPKHCR